MDVIASDALWWLAAADGSGQVKVKDNGTGYVG